MSSAMPPGVGAELEKLETTATKAVTALLAVLAAIAGALLAANVLTGEARVVALAIVGTAATFGVPASVFAASNKPIAKPLVDASVDVIPVAVHDDLALDDPDDGIDDGTDDGIDDGTDAAAAAATQDLDDGPELASTDAPEVASVDELHPAHAAALSGRPMPGPTV